VRTAFAIAAVMFALAACGGGGTGPAAPRAGPGGQGNGGLPPQPPGDPPRSSIHVDFTARPVFPWDNLRNPLWVQVPSSPGAVWDRNEYNENDENTVVIGPGVYGLELVDLYDLEEAGAHGNYALHYERVNDGTDASTLTSLLTTNDAGLAKAMKRWGNEPPTVHVHVGPGTGPELVAETELIVKYINSALPLDWQLQYSNEGLSVPIAADRGKIQVVFAPADTWPSAGHATLGLTQVQVSPDGEILSAQIWMDPEQNQPETIRLKVLAHEMLHALGREHANPSRFRETILHPTVNEFPAIPPVLRQMDNEALLAVYGFLEVGQNAGEVLQALGSWETESNHLAATLAFGDSGRIGFGASERNALVRPWAVGTPVPGLPLSANKSLSGQATWSGRLVGLTPASAAVAGDVDMTVDLADLSGNLDVTNLEVWAANAAPGAAGSGTPWRDGGLSYAITVTGNSFRHMAGSQDDGEIAGSFLGAGHEAMVGELRRFDLSAGFGGVRQ